MLSSTWPSTVAGMCASSSLLPPARSRPSPQPTGSAKASTRGCSATSRAMWRHPETHGSRSRPGLSSSAHGPFPSGPRSVEVGVIPARYRARSPSAGLVGRALHDDGPTYSDTAATAERVGVRHVEDALAAGPRRVRGDALADGCGRRGDAPGSEYRRRTTERLQEVGRSCRAACLAGARGAATSTLASTRERAGWEVRGCRSRFRRCWRCRCRCRRGSGRCPWLRAAGRRRGHRGWCRCLSCREPCRYRCRRGSGRRRHHR